VTTDGLQAMMVLVTEPESAIADFKAMVHLSIANVRQ
jgi:hypothetical protein